MAKILLLKNYNNYFNRIIKGYSDLSDYQTAVGTGNYELDTQINFNPNDNVSAELIINDCPFDADYLIVADDTTSDIISRWFILESKRTRKGQYALSLRRDVIFDYQAELMDSPVFIHKAVLPVSDPLILNSEGMNFNEIKTEETLLKDKTGCSWIVIYLAKNATPASISVSHSPEEINALALSTIASAAGMTEPQLAAVLNFIPNTTPAFFTDEIEFRYGIKFMPNTQSTNLSRIRNFFNGDMTKKTVSNNPVLSWNKPLFVGDEPLPIMMPDSVGDKMQTALYNNRSAILAQMPTIKNQSYYFSTSQLKALKKYNGRYIAYNSKYYTFSIDEAATQDDPVIGPSVYTTYSSIATAVNNSGLTAYLNNQGEISIRFKSVKAYINAEEISTSGTQFAAATVQISSTRNTLQDQNFDIIAIPYGPHKINGTTARGSLSKRVAQAIGLQLTDANVYDIQLLPYCPVPELVDSTGSITLIASQEHYLFDWVELGGGLVDTAIIYPKENSFSIQLNYALSLKDNMKIEACCNKYRLCSPNYQGSFDFNVAKNGGSVDYFTADCTYKPYTPYIRVVPNFNYLYGTAFGDNRGLICGGDYSFGIISSPWQQYQLNNKNYQNIFNREIQSLDLEQSIQMRNQLVSSSVGVVSSTAAGAGAGAFTTGSWVGALIGGVAGGTGSAVGAYIDTDTMSRQQRDAKSLAIDKYNYQLGNIKALPYTLTKVCAFDINSKIWPFLEYYTCTDAEKEALESKIAYESMTVMKIGLFGTYFKAFDTPRYFKGELIRCEAIAEDNHVLEAIYSELLKGVFM